MTTSATDLDGQRRTALASILAAGLLVVLKLGAGLVTGSLGLVSAGIESSGDVVAALLTFFAIRLGGRPADEDHHYGHRRAENLGALGEAAILAGGGIFIVTEAVQRLIDGGGDVDTGWYVFAVVALAIAVDAGRVVVSLRTSRRYGSAALRSNAFHFAGDMAGSLAVLAGLAAVAAGLGQGDAIASIVVAGIVFAAASRLVYENALVLMDTAPADAEQQAREAVERLGDVELRRLRLRESGGRFFADAVVGVPPGQAVVESHVTADSVEDAVHAVLPGSDVVVHLEPISQGLDLRDRALSVALAEPLVREAHDIVLYEHDGLVSVSLHLKLPADTGLRAAHDVAERVEATLRAEPGVSDVQTHLEPLERPQATLPSTYDDAADSGRVGAIVTRRTGSPPREVSIMRTADGDVVFVTVGVAPDLGLTAAHDLASRLEEDIRRGRPRMADVVVHTEPLPAG